MAAHRKCNLANSKVIDTRVSKNGLSIRRRRECLETGYRFTTVEEILREGLTVIKRDGRREPFDREKIVQGIRRATEKRPIHAEQVEMLINEVLDALDQEFDNEIPGQAIGEAIMARLRSIDHIAYVRFASVYKEFRDIDALDAEIRDLRNYKPS